MGILFHAGSSQREGARQEEDEGWWLLEQVLFIKILTDLFIFLVLELQHTDTAMGACERPRSLCHTTISLA